MTFSQLFRIFLVNNTPARARRLAKRELSKPLPF